MRNDLLLTTPSLSVSVQLACSGILTEHPGVLDPLQEWQAMVGLAADIVQGVLGDMPQVGEARKEEDLKEGERGGKEQGVKQVCPGMHITIQQRNLTKMNPLKFPCCH